MKNYCIVTYLKNNGETFIRPYSFTSREIGDETSMGWKIIDIHYKYKDNYICYDDYMKILKKQVSEHKNKKIIKFLIKKLSKYAIKHHLRFQPFSFS